MTELNTLGQSKKNSYDGDIILQTLEMATNNGFGHVAKFWHDQCMTFDKGLEKLSQDQQKIEDIYAPLNDWKPVVHNTVFKLEYKDGRQFTPTTHTLDNMAATGRMSRWTLQSLIEPVRHQTKVDKETDEKVVLWHRDNRDAELIKRMVEVHLFQPDRIDMKKQRLWRTWNDGTLRAFLSEKYAIINNIWYLEVLKKLIPGGLLSHWKGDADSIYGNVLIPDTIRTDKDSDYGGMLSIGNSEIGLRRISSQPSVFRAICMNGCIWDQEKGVAIDKVHRGNIDLTLLEEAIKHNLEKQIPLLDTGIQRLLGIKAYGVGDTPIRNVFAQLAKENSINKSGIAGIANAYGIEAGILGQDVKTAFGLQAAVTRYGQINESPEQWVRYDMIGGKFANMSRNKWDGFLQRALTLDEDETDKILGDKVLI